MGAGKRKWGCDRTDDALHAAGERQEGRSGIGVEMGKRSISPRGAGRGKESQGIGPGASRVGVFS